MNWLQRTAFNFLGLDNLIDGYLINPATFKNELHGNYDVIQLTTDELKINAMLSNPAFLKVVVTLCDLFSLGDVYVYKNGKQQKTDPFLDMIKKPNYFQGKQQFLWDFMFRSIVGNAYCAFESNQLKEDNIFYWLNTVNMKFPKEMEDIGGKLIYSKKAAETIGEYKIDVKDYNNNTNNIYWKNIVYIPSLSNGLGSWFRSPSKIDALYDVIANSKTALEAKNINAKYSGKYMVSGQADANNVHQMPMGEDEKKDIETKLNGRKKVHAVKSMIDIKRFVENASILEQLDKSYLTDYFIIGTLFGIPKDVLEGLNSSTFENQEKARGALVSYCLQPLGNQLMNSLQNFFNVSDRNFVIDWEHLPFMQVFAIERANAKTLTIDTFIKMKDAGIDLKQINEFLDTKFKLNEIKPEQPTGTDQQIGADQSQNQQSGTD